MKDFHKIKRNKKGRYKSTPKQQEKIEGQSLILVEHHNRLPN